MTPSQEKLNEAVMVMNKTLQDINIQNMNIELVAQMFKNYQSNVLFHLEGNHPAESSITYLEIAADRTSYRQLERSIMMPDMAIERQVGSRLAVDFTMHDEQ